MKDFFAREREMARKADHDLINVKWDRDFLDAFTRGDVEHMFAARYEEVERDGGNGGHEMALWVALMGALDGAPARQITYEPVMPWMGGVGLATYSVAHHRAAA